jgi:argininosuccinate lyase
MRTNNKKSMWGGRFTSDPDEFMMQFGASITYTKPQKI